MNGPEDGRKPDFYDSLVARKQLFLLPDGLSYRVVAAPARYPTFLSRTRHSAYGGFITDGVYALFDRPPYEVRLLAYRGRFVAARPVSDDRHTYPTMAAAEAAARQAATDLAAGRRPTFDPTG